jgi:hypothetical protein
MPTGVSDSLVDVTAMKVKHTNTTSDVMDQASNSDSSMALCDEWIRLLKWWVDRLIDGMNGWV